MNFLTKAAILAAIAVIAAFVIPQESVSSQSNYETMSAQDKYNWLWQRILTDTNSGSWPSTIAAGKLFIEDMAVTMDTKSDVFPSGRQKLIHSVGAIAGVKFEAAPGTNYTGFFQGAEHAFVRCSNAAEPKRSETDPEKFQMIPGCALKFLRDGMYSGNFVFMRGLTPQNSFNFFKYPFSNHVSNHGFNWALKILAKKFSTASDWASYVGLSDLATWDEKGQAHQNPQFPFQLIFVPNPELTAQFPDTKDKYYIDQLLSIPANLKLWEVHAKDTPNSPARLIGSLTTQTPFVTSKFADETMFFKHQRYDEDLKLRPEFLNGCPEVYKCDVCPFDKSC